MLAVGIGPRSDGIVHNNEMASATRDTRSHASREIDTSLGGIPEVGGFGVGGKGDAGEDVLIEVGMDEISNLSSEESGEVGIVAGCDDLLLRMPSEVESREVDGCQLGLSCPWGSLYDETLAFTAAYSFKGFGYEVVMTSGLIAGHRIPGEGNEALLGILPGYKLTRRILRRNDFVSHLPDLLRSRLYNQPARHPPVQS